MDILILEDSSARCELFKKYLKEHNLFFCDNVDDAKILIDNQKFDMIFLDHDLEGQIYVNSNYENTGYQVAKYIASKNIESQIIIHTMNYSGARNMRSVLPKAKCISFSRLLKAWDLKHI